MPTPANLTALAASIETAIALQNPIKPDSIQILAEIKEAIGDSGGASLPSIASANGAISNANAPATITYAANATQSHAIDGHILFGYSGDPTATGLLTITTGANTVTVPVSKGGAGFIPFAGKGAVNTSLVVSLSAGGSGIIGYVNVIGKSLV